MVKVKGDKVRTRPSGPGRVVIFSKMKRCPRVALFITVIISEVKVLPVPAKVRKSPPTVVAMENDAISKFISNSKPSNLGIMALANASSSLEMRPSRLPAIWATGSGTVLTLNVEVPMLRDVPSIIAFAVI